MTVGQLSNTEGFASVCMPAPERTIHGGYIGDLLSWVMGRAEADNAWITIMNNINVIAVATLSDVACVILAEGVTLDESIQKTAEQKGINVLSTSLSAYDAAIALHGVLK